MHTAYQPVVEVLGDTLALMTRRERGVWSLHDTNTDILAIAKGRFKAPPHINHSLSQVGLSVRSLIGILAEGWFDDSPTCSGWARADRSESGCRPDRTARRSRARWSTRRPWSSVQGRGS